MVRDRKRIIARAAGAALCVLLVSSFGTAVRAAGYPDRQITLVVPYVPGGVTDLAARAYGDALQHLVKQTVIVVNKAGGGTTIGGNAVATAKPDGYTIGFFPTSASLPEVFTYFNEAPYTSRDLKAVSRVAGPVLAITVRADSPYRSLKDLVEAGRKAKNMKMATHGKSTLGYIVMRTVGKAEGIDFIDVPFPGDAQIVPAILGGHVPFGTPAYPAIKPLVDGGKLRVLALCIQKRADFAPSLPTVVELGYKLAFVSYVGLFAPKGTPDDVVKKLDEATRAICGQSDFRTKLNNMGTQLTYEDTASFNKSLASYRKGLAVFFKEEGFVK